MRTISADAADAHAHLSVRVRNLLTVLEMDWRRMGGNGAAPASMRLSAAELDAALPYTFVLQRTSPGVSRIRVAGRALHEMAQMDPRGMSFGVFFQPETKTDMLTMVDKMFARPSICSVPLRAPRRLGRRFLAAQCLLLPMHDSTGELTRVMGAIVPDGPIARSGHRFSIDPDIDMRMQPLDGQFPDRRMGSRAPERKISEHLAPAPAASQRDEAAMPRPTRPRLRLVVDNT